MKKNHLHKWWLPTATITLALIGIYFASRQSFILSHTLVELLTISIYFAIFAVNWNSRQFARNDYLVLIGISFLFIAILDAFHTISQRGNSIFATYESTDLAMESIATWYIMGFSLILGPLFIRRKLRAEIVFSAGAVLVFLLLINIFSLRIFPVNMLDESGLTLFGKIHAALIPLVLVGAIVQLVRYRKEFDRAILSLLLVSVVTALMAVVSFIIDMSSFGLLYRAAHLFKTVSSYVMYIVFVEISLLSPYELLFRGLKQKEEALAEQAEKLVFANTGLNREVIERRQSEEALKSQWNTLASILDVMDDRVYVLNQQDEIEYLNPGIKERYGPVNGKKCYEYFHHGSVRCPWCRNKEVFAGKTVRYEWHSDSTGKTYDVVSTPVKNAAGALCKLTVLHDITQREQAKSEIQFQTKILSNVKDAVIVVDKELMIAAWNNAAEQMFGWKASEVLGRPVSEALHWKFFNGNASEYFQALAGIKSVHPQFLETRKDGTPVYVDSSFFVVRNDKGHITGYAGLLWDITDKKRDEAELISSREQLRNFSRHLEKVREEEGQAIAREIHDDFGPTLAALKMEMSLLTERLPGPANGEFEPVQRMEKLIDTALFSAQSVIAKLRPRLVIDLGLSSAIKWQAEEFQKHTGIECRLNLRDGDSALPEAQSIPAFRIFQEALANVARHSKAASVEVCLEEKGGKLVLTVRDNGKGITADQISDFKSFGILGMRERALSCGGDLKITGAEGQGTTVTLSIPIIEVV